MTTTFLEPEEITALTNKQRSPAQAKALNGMGIEYKIRPDGSIAILRAHINKVFGAEPEKARKTRTAQPDWAAI